MTSFKIYIDSFIEERRQNKKLQRVVNFIDSKITSIIIPKSEGIKVPANYGKYDSIEDFFKYLSKFNVDRCVIKPVWGHGNLGVFLLELQKDSICFYDHMRHKKFSANDLIDEFYSETTGKCSRQVLVEEVVDNYDDSFFVPLDFRMFCVNSKVELIMQRNVNKGRDPKLWESVYYDDNWSIVNAVKGRKASLDLKCPPLKIGAELMEVATRLSKKIPLPFIRVDLYASSNGVFFGEFTAAPGTYKRFTDEWDFKIGKSIAASELMLDSIKYNKKIDEFAKKYGI